VKACVVGETHCDQRNSSKREQTRNVHLWKKTHEVTTSGSKSTLSGSKERDARKGKGGKGNIFKRHFLLLSNVGRLAPGGDRKGGQGHALGVKDKKTKKETERNGPENPLCSTEKRKRPGH